MFVPNYFTNTINHTQRRGRVIGSDLLQQKLKRGGHNRKARPKPEWKSGMDSGDVEENYGSSLGGAKRPNKIWSLPIILSSPPSLSASLTALQPFGPCCSFYMAKTSF